jgi:hypothetical protein
LRIKKSIVEGLGFRVWGYGYRLCGSQFRVYGLRVMDQGSGFKL